MKKTTMDLRARAMLLISKAEIAQYTREEFSSKVTIQAIMEGMPKYLNTGYNRAYMYGFLDCAISEFWARNTVFLYEYEGTLYTLKNQPCKDLAPWDSVTDFAHFTKHAIGGFYYKDTLKKQ
jgi:hypothetical protein